MLHVFIASIGFLLSFAPFLCFLVKKDFEMHKYIVPFAFSVWLFPTFFSFTMTAPAIVLLRTEQKEEKQNVCLQRDEMLVYSIYYFIGVD